MIERLGIIPAAGKAERWGGVLKELLPVQNGETLLDHTLKAMQYGRADASVIVTNREKLQAHANHLKNWQIYYTIQLGKQDAWSAIVESLPIHGKLNLYAMPDTYYPVEVFEELNKGDFNIAYFNTEQPERFGVLCEHGIMDKQDMPKGTYKAWGVLSWSDRVARFWIQNLNKITTHTQAFNMAINEFNFTVKKMNYYHDIASWSDYKELVNAV